VTSPGHNNITLLKFLPKTRIKTNKHRSSCTKVTSAGFESRIVEIADDNSAFQGVGGGGRRRETGSSGCMTSQDSFVSVVSCKKAGGKWMGAYEC
jgi:hypothetical protein